MKASSLRKGKVIIYNAQPYRIMEANHSTPGNLRARVQMKLRNLLNGNQSEVRFGATEDVEEADIFMLNASYLYADANGYHFMNTENYEQIAIQPDTLGDAKFYLQDGMQVRVTLWNENPIGIELPSTVVLTIVDTEPELRGATASNSPKPAKMDTGLQITVPAFLNIGDKVIVNTEEGTYISRA